MARRRRSGLGVLARHALAGWAVALEDHHLAGRARRPGGRPCSPQTPSGTSRCIRKTPVLSGGPGECNGSTPRPWVGRRLGAVPHGSS